MGFLSRIFNRAQQQETPTQQASPPAPAPWTAPPVAALTVPPSPVTAYGPGFAVVDVETTGLSASSDRVIELAIVRLDTAGQVVDEWCTRLNPQQPVGASWVHGITDTDVANSPLFVDVADQVAQRLDGAVFVAHNARFDAGFVLSEFVRAGWDVPEPTIWCTQAASHHWMPAAPSRRLAELTSAAGIPLTDAHSALGDARATAALLARFLGAASGADRLEDLATTAAALPGPIRSTQVSSHIYVDVPPLTIYPRRPTRERKVPARLRTYRLPDTTFDGLPDAVRAYALDLASRFPTVSDEVRDELATKHGLDADDQRSAHELLLSAMAGQVVADGRVTSTEQSDLGDLADSLGLPTDAATVVIAAATAARTQRLGEKVRPLPAGWSYGSPLRIGDVVVFTGEFPNRHVLTAKAGAAGLRVVGKVSNKTAMLVTDGAFFGGKAARAAELGTRVVTPEDFKAMLRHIQHAPAPEKPKARPTRAVPPASEPAAPVRAGLQVEPAAVRAWARENGFAVGGRGRLPATALAAYRLAHPQGVEQRVTDDTPAK